jgi:hypothetical protein
MLKVVDSREITVHSFRSLDLFSTFNIIGHDPSEVCIKLSESSAVVFSNLNGYRVQDMDYNMPVRYINCEIHIID